MSQSALIRRPDRNKCVRVNCFAIQMTLTPNRLLLNSHRAIEVSVYLVRAFVQQRELLASNKDLARQLRALEQRIEKKLGSHDHAIAGIINTLRELMSPAAKPKCRIGFVIDDDK